MSQVTGVAVSSVVPPLDSTLRRAAELYFKVKPLFVEPGVRTGLPILTDNPAEVGADRIVNCVAAHELFKNSADRAPASSRHRRRLRHRDHLRRHRSKGEFLGGAIAPGLGISAEALFSRAARLPRVDIRKPAKVDRHRHRRQPADRPLLRLHWPGRTRN